jgi:hypothetical protein
MFKHLRRAIRMRQLVAGIVGLSLGLLGNIAASYLFEARSWLVYLISAVFVISVILLVFLDLRGPARVKLNLRPVKTIRTKAEQQSVARSGLIGMVSLYRPMKNSHTPPTSKPEDWKAAAEHLDYAYLDLPNSNLAPLIEAITMHASRLQHCWLIATTSSDSRFWGSSVYAPALVAYLQTERNLKCQFYYGPELELPLDDDAEVFTRTLDRTHKILEQARHLGLAEENVISDFTGGVRGMTLGMILGRLDSDRDVQMIGTHYAPDGAPIPPLLPVIFSFEPVLQNG